MKKVFMEKHNLTDQDWRNLIRYENARRGKMVNMADYLAIMKKHNANGGSKLADFIVKGNNYENFLKVLKVVIK